MRQQKSGNFFTGYAWRAQCEAHANFGALFSRAADTQIAACLPFAVCVCVCVNVSVKSEWRCVLALAARSRVGRGRVAWVSAKIRCPLLGARARPDQLHDLI